MIGGLVLAAGRGERFGSESKLLADLWGKPLVERPIAALARSPGVDRVVVVVGPDVVAEIVRDLAARQEAETVVAQDAADGQSASLRAGVHALADCEAIVVVLGDQPLISPAAVRRVLAGRDTAPTGPLAVRAVYDGVPGHPVVLERALFDRVRALSGDAGARDLLEGVPVRDVPCDGAGSALDVDTPEDLETVRRRRRLG
jgi:molybdenum cofactor cytidylyltransferase